jgi:uncharacterized protein (DUF983 family)
MEKKINNDGFGLLGLLTVLFIGLKLTGNINWSWLWVLSPIWISVVLSIILAIIFYPVFAEMYKD